MFKQGDRIHTHDGKVHRVGAGGRLPKMGRRRGELPRVRGFVRGALVDCLTGAETPGDWHENVITTYGHGIVAKNFAGIVATNTSGMAANLTDLALARYWGIGSMSEAQSSNFSTKTGLDVSWYGLASTDGHNQGARVAVSAGSQVLSGTWTLSQSYQYASSQISHQASINAIAQYAHSSNSSNNGALSIATFASSTKGTTQALNITYNFLFST